MTSRPRRLRVQVATAPGSIARRGIAIYLVVWAVIFPIQTVVVHAENPDDIVPSYFVINALILAGGIGLNTLGARLRRSLHDRTVVES